MLIKRLEECPPFNPGLPLKVTTMGNVIEVQYMDRKNTKQTIKMLAGGDQYVECSTGEIKDVTHHTCRLEQKKSLMRTFKALRGVINANVEDVSKVRWITLTYAENMQDTRKLYKDFEKFNKRFQYHIQKLGYDKAEYIAVAEPQARGAWHMHVLYIFDKKAPYLHNDTVFNPIWGHGITKIKQLKDCTNLGAYLTAYLGDMTLEEFAQDFVECSVKAQNFFGGENIGKGIKEVEIEDENGARTPKKVIKGMRLAFYPAKFNMFRTSRGIKRPVQELLSQDAAADAVAGHKLTWQKTVALHDEHTDFKTFVNVRQYTKRECGNLGVCQ